MYIHFLWAAAEPVEIFFDNNQPLPLTKVTKNVKMPGYFCGCRRFELSCSFNLMTYLQ